MTEENSNTKNSRTNNDAGCNDGEGNEVIAALMLLESEAAGYLYNSSRTRRMSLKKHQDFNEVIISDLITESFISSSVYHSMESDEIKFFVRQNFINGQTTKTDFFIVDKKNFEGSVQVKTDNGSTIINSSKSGKKLLFSQTYQSKEDADKIADNIRVATGKKPRYLSTIQAMSGFVPYDDGSDSQFFNENRNLAFLAQYGQGIRPPKTSHKQQSVILHDVYEFLKYKYPQWDDESYENWPKHIMVIPKDLKFPLTSDSFTINMFPLTLDNVKKRIFPNVKFHQPSTRDGGCPQVKVEESENGEWRVVVSFPYSIRSEKIK